MYFILLLLLASVYINVLKTGSDRPVQPVGLSTGEVSGPVSFLKPTTSRTGSEPPKPVVKPINR